ncbi:Major facilitator superfamily domain, general substrate transporter [Ostreococcus tauri]|jgi:hypothetical protein|uniref:Major facilitator superfamily domain, general substrate transporter n=1 Tax=Ostreococcus tauri TaxID=70448 RepID=A0A090M7Q5_OSTTA|nr:Major facilitator superfamily domain, general substrate transporter [Ostreococcus tauri]OUS42133.1 major facilitator superfamily domain-containing protein [Ostreococcus tauri]CEG01068.1 Major facilitator superfamily domain, general substrate transporter [Ostreococcus tauri]|eukprot:XP_003075124.2 Major facilitator superfamily domain, general substrate transporter [Ostreococcus tauri]
MAGDAVETRKRSAIGPFAVVSLSYILFTLTDGAVRMLVLMHAYATGFTAMEVATTFTLYELCGAVTNLVAGIAGARFGIRQTLVSGLVLQIGGIGMLFAWDDAWGRGRAIVFVTCAQALCGIAKDLTKLGGKTVTKLVTPDDKQNSLFKLVSAITGLKNSFKGVGYFIGAAMLGVSYEAALWTQIGIIVVALPFGIFGLDSSLGRVGKENITLSAVFKQNYNMNVLSLSRMFLFGSRDLWFEVPLPFFLRSAEGMGWPRSAVGAMLAGYIIVYGQLQAWTPQLFLQPLRQNPPNKHTAVVWNFALVSVPLFLGGFVQSGVFQDHPGDSKAKSLVIFIAVFVFAFLFAVNSAVHSYLVVKYAEGNKVAINVGFYYMANAFGRLIGTIVSGALYSYVGSTVDGFAACFWASAAFVIASTVIELFLDDDSGGLMCGSIACIDDPDADTNDVESTQPPS